MAIIVDRTDHLHGLDGMDAQHRPNTGVRPVDSVVYRREQPVLAWRHLGTDIAVARTLSFGTPGTFTSAIRQADTPDLLMITRGVGGDTTGKLAGTPFRLVGNRAWRLTFAPHGADAEVHYETGSLGLNLWFPPGLLNTMLAEDGVVPLAPLLFRSDPDVFRLAEMLAQEVADPGFAADLLVEGLARAMASLLARLDGIAQPEAERLHLPPWRLKRVLDYIEARLAEPIGLTDLAEVAGLSPFHFSRMFKLATGTTPYRHVRDRRLDTACRMLRETQLPIDAIASTCGFGSTSHFTTAFSKAMRQPPARYRRDHRH